MKRGRKARQRPESSGPSISKMMRFGAFELRMFETCAKMCGDESWAAFVARSARECAARILLTMKSEASEIELRIAAEIAKAHVTRKKALEAASKEQA